MKKYQRNSEPVFLLNSGFSTEKKFQRNELLTVLQNEFLLSWKRNFLKISWKRIVGAPYWKFGITLQWTTAISVIW